MRSTFHRIWTCVAVVVSISPLSPCLQEFCWLRRIAGANADSGTILSNNRIDEAGCVRSCLNSVSVSCHAVDYSVTDQHCYMHSNVDSQQPALCCTRYEYTCSHNGPCQDDLLTFLHYSISKVSAGELISRSTTEASCQQTCLTRPDCTRVVYRRPGVCYLFTTQVELFIAEQNTIVYARRTCVGIGNYTTHSTRPATRPSAVTDVRPSSTASRFTEETQESRSDVATVAPTSSADDVSAASDARARYFLPVVVTLSSVAATVILLLALVLLLWIRQKRRAVTEESVRPTERTNNETIRPDVSAVSCAPGDYQRIDRSELAAADSGSYAKLTVRAYLSLMPADMSDYCNITTECATATVGRW